MFTVDSVEKTKIKTKEAVNGPFVKKTVLNSFHAWASKIIIEDGVPYVPKW